MSFSVHFEQQRIAAPVDNALDLRFGHIEFFGQRLKRNPVEKPAPEDRPVAFAVDVFVDQRRHFGV